MKDEEQIKRFIRLAKAMKLIAIAEGNSKTIESTKGAIAALEWVLGLKIDPYGYDNVEFIESLTQKEF